MKAHEGEWKNTKHGLQWQSTLASYVYPVFGDLLVGAVDEALILKALTPIWNTKTETAKRIRGRIEAVLDWATFNKYRQGENPARWKGHLEHSLAKPSKVAKVKHHPALSYKLIAGFMSELRKRDGVGPRAVEFLILTGARSGEVRGAKWSEVDWEQKTWVIPADRMKAEREHRVPLTLTSCKSGLSASELGRNEPPSVTPRVSIFLHCSEMLPCLNVTVLSF
jgi:integrase